MILSFSEDSFKEKILAGLKIHTIRTDRTERWKKGMKINFWRGNPRNTKMTPKPHQFHESTCTSVQKLDMDFVHGGGLKVYVDNRELEPFEVEALALADGFNDAKQMEEWFLARVPANSFKGRLIHWTKTKY